jgi:hypothetical protein
MVEFTMRHKQMWVAGTLVAIFLAILPGAIFAQDVDQINLGISPQVLELSANPGDVIKNEVRLTNGSDQAIEIETIPKNFTPTGEEGGVNLTEDETSFSLADWITVIPSSIIIPAETTQDFEVTISVPTNAEPGGHFGSVAFKTVPPPAGDGNSAQVSQEIAPVILLKVAGDIVEEANISSFESSKSFWSNENPITFDTRIENTGNVHFKPSGNITIKNMFGGVVTVIPLEEKNTLPDSIRKITTDWSDPGFAVGKYTAELTVVYGANDTFLTAETDFIVFPYQTIVPAFLLIVVLLYVLIRFRKRIGLAFKVLSGK